MGIADFFKSEPADPKETVSREELDELRESADSYRMLRRELEDVGYYLLNAKIGDIDLKPVQREKFYRRTLKYYLEDPIVMRAVDMQPHYIFGRGLPRPESTNPLVQQAIDKFWDDEDNKLALTTFKAQYARAVELQLQANIYFVVFETDDGIKVGTLPHEEVVDIVMDPENRLRPVWYKRRFVEQIYDFKTGAYQPAAEPKVIWYQDWKHESPRGFRPPAGEIAKGRIFHVKVGSTGEMKFGVPPVQRILDWAKAHNEWMRARVAVAKAAAQFAWERKLKTGSDPNRVMSMAKDWASGRHQSLTGATGEWGDEDPMSSPRYASMLTTNEGVEYVFKGGNQTGAGDASSDQKMFRSQISAGTGLPQHFLGDEGSANLATATAMNEPVIRMMEFLQEMWEDIYRQIIDKHLEAMGLSPKKVPVSLNFQEWMAEAASKSWQDTPGDMGILDREQEREGESAAFKIADGVIIDATEPMDNNKPVYKLAFPPILNRDVGSMLGLVIDAVTGLDPAGDNTDLTRWAFKEILKVMGEMDPDKIVDSIFPSSSMADAATTNEEKAAVKGEFEDPNMGAPVAMSPEMMPVGMGPPPAGMPVQPPNGQAPGRKANNLNTPGGLGYSMDGAQNGARMGASLQEAELIDYDEIKQIWEQIESDLLEMVNEKVE
jgi:hypothetical protein